MKPGVSCARTGVWPHRRASAVRASVTHGAVMTPPITSTSFISGTGLKKWKPPTRSRPLARGCDRGDLQRRGVGRDEAVVGHHRFEVTEELALRRQVLDDRFDDDVARGEVRQHVRDLDQAGGAGGRVGCDPALLRELAERAGDVVLGRRRRVGPGVVEHDADARLRGDLRDPPAHDAGADDTEGEVRTLDVERHDAAS